MLGTETMRDFKLFENWRVNPFLTRFVIFDQTPARVRFGVPLNVGAWRYGG